MTDFNTLNSIVSEGAKEHHKLHFGDFSSAAESFGSGFLRTSLLDTVQNIGQQQKELLGETVGATRYPIPAEKELGVEKLEKALPDREGGYEKAGEIGGILAGLVKPGYSLAKLGGKGALALLKKMPGGLEAAGKLINSRFNTILEELGGKTEAAEAILPENASDQLYSNMQSKYEGIRNRENEAYTNLDAKLKSITPAVPIKTSSTQEAIVNQLKSLPRVKATERTQELAGHLSELKGLTEDARSIMDLKNIDSAINERLRDPGVISKIKDFSRYVSPIKEGIIKDVENAAMKAKSPEVMNQWQEAKKITREEKAPFISERSPRGGVVPTSFAKMLHLENPETGKYINSLISNARSDDIGKLQKVLKLMPEEENRNLIGLHYLKEGTNDPRKFIQRWNALGSKTKKFLFPNHHEELNKFARLYKEHPEAFSSVAPPSILGKTLAGTKLFLGRAGGEPVTAASFLLGKVLGKVGSKIAFESPKVQAQLIKELQSIPIKEAKSNYLSHLSSLMIGSQLQKQREALSPTYSDEDVNSIVQQLKEMKK